MEERVTGPPHDEGGRSGPAELGADPDNILGEPGMPTRPSYPLSQDSWSASSASRMVSSGLPSECLRFRRAQDFGRGALAGVGTAHRVIPAIYEWIGSVMVNR